MIDAVLFDLDGTLVDSVADIAASANHVRERMGRPPLPIDSVRSFVGDGVRMLFERVIETHDTAVIDEAVALWRPHYTEHCLDQTVLYAGIGPLLDQLAASNMAMAVVTNKPIVPSEKILDGLGVGGLFRCIVGGDTIPERKPDPAPFRLALEQMRVASRHVLVVGDASNDIEGARNAGLKSCGVLWGLNSSDKIRTLKPDHVASHPDEILGMIGG